MILAWSRMVEIIKGLTNDWVLDRGGKWNLQDLQMYWKWRIREKKDAKVTPRFWSEDVCMCCLLRRADWGRRILGDEVGNEFVWETIRYRCLLDSHVKKSSAQLDIWIRSSGRKIEMIAGTLQSLEDMDVRMNQLRRRKSKSLLCRRKTKRECGVLEAKRKKQFKREGLINCRMLVINQARQDWKLTTGLSKLEVIGKQASVISSEHQPQWTTLSSSLLLWGSSHNL